MLLAMGAAQVETVDLLWRGCALIKGATLAARRELLDDVIRSASDFPATASWGGMSSATPPGGRWSWRPTAARPAIGVL